MYEASAGLLPGTASFEQIVENFLRDAEARGVKSLSRLNSATKHLLKELRGYRAEQIEAARWLKYLVDRGKEAADDTVHLELSIARQIYRVALRYHLVRTKPEIPKVKHRVVRHGFIEPPDWMRVREHLLPDLREACDFALACGAREMEVLSMKWDKNVNLHAAEVSFLSTKTDQPRKVPFGSYPQLREVVERRLAVHERLKKASVISPWVFCFERPVQVHGRIYHHAGDPLFGDAEHGLYTMLRENLVAACDEAHVPRLLFHDLRRSAARNFERTMPRSVARKIGGWSDAMYSRYAIGAESEMSDALARNGEFLNRNGWHSVGTTPKSPRKSLALVAEGGGSRTLRRA